MVYIRINGPMSEYGDDSDNNIMKEGNENTIKYRFYTKAEIQ